MKTSICVILLFCVQPIIGQTTNPSPYCPHQYDDGAVPKTHYISQVTTGSFTNFTGYTQFPFPHYVYYNNLSPIHFIPGSTQNLTVHFDTAGTKSLIIYIDWNLDGMLDASEWYNLPLNPGDSMSSALINVPWTFMGVTRMRVILTEDTTQGMSACGIAFDWGETEDYQVYVGVTGIASYNQGTIGIYPNPSNGAFKISCNQNIEMINLYTITSQLVFEKVCENQKEVDLNLDATPGLYMLALKTKEGWVRKKLVVE